MTQHVSHRHSDEIAQLNARIEELEAERDRLLDGVNNQARQIDELHAAIQRCNEDFMALLKDYDRSRGVLGL